MLGGGPTVKALRGHPKILRRRAKHRALLTAAEEGTAARAQQRRQEDMRLTGPSSSSPLSRSHVNLRPPPTIPCLALALSLLSAANQQYCPEPRGAQSGVGERSGSD